MRVTGRLMEVVILAQAASTWAMVGIIWFAQIVHYPALALVGTDTFTGYQESNMRRTGWVVGPLMLAEILTALLILWQRPQEIPSFLAWMGVGLIAVIWLSTAALQVPRHNALHRRFDPQTHHSLVATNWLRTAAWSIRGILVLVMLMS